MLLSPQQLRLLLPPVFLCNPTAAAGAGRGGKKTGSPMGKRGLRSFPSSESKAQGCVLPFLGCKHKCLASGPRFAQSRSLLPPRVEENPLWFKLKGRWDERSAKRNKSGEGLAPGDLFCSQKLTLVPWAWLSQQTYRVCPLSSPLLSSPFLSFPLFSSDMSTAPSNASSVTSTAKIQP